ncbi:MAG: phosphoribosylamine--glycine ligase [Oligoflexia bacterium]|nr:phosphoribosylamine--glycine ligase [Oligoflexia bacterium]
MNVLILGSGGREHALYYKILNDGIKGNYKESNKVYVLPGNGGIPKENRVDLKIDDFDSIYSFAIKNCIDLIIPGSEYPLSLGIVDYFNKREKKINIFGPNKKAALLETSKIYSKNFMLRNNIPTAKIFSVSDDSNDTDDAKEVIIKLNGNLVLKYDGLAQGKGVFVCSSVNEANKAFNHLINTYGDACGAGEKQNYIIEERLIGPELSIITIIDSINDSYLIFPPARDYKKILEGDLGSNTGGMGAIAPIPLSCELLNEIKNNIIGPTLAALKKEKIIYQGFLYFGLILTTSGVKVLEYNVRLGDPETQVILPLIENDLIDLLESTLKGTLKEKTIKIKNKKALAVVLTSKGYPDKYEIGKDINYKKPLEKNTLFFHAGTKEIDNKIVTNGGRVMSVVSLEDDFKNAKFKCYEECKKIDFEGNHYRTDIGINICKKVAVFISGKGSNLKALIDSTLFGELKDLAKITVIVSSNPNAEGLIYSNSYPNVTTAIPTIVVDSSKINRLEFEEKILDQILPMNLDYIVLAGFMRILSPYFISHFQNKIINIHPADPKVYRGPKAYEYAFKNKLDKTKITVHFVDEYVDNGKIILQEEIDIKQQNIKTIVDLKNIGLNIEHKIYTKALKKCVEY